MKVTKEKAERHKKHAELLDTAAMPFEADKVRECGKMYNQWRCDGCGEKAWTIVQPCNSKFCPDCQQARSARAYAAYHTALEAVKEPRMIVLTVRNVNLGELHFHLKEFSKCLTRMWSNYLKPRAKGALCAIEVTYNRETRTWHPHAHILVDGDYIEQAWIANVWKKITKGWGLVVWVQKCDPGWEHELLKYVTKDFAFLDVPQAVREFHYGTKHFRFLRAWGSFYAIRKDEELDHWDRLCPLCGTPMVLEEKNISRDRLLADGNGIYGPGSDRYHDPPPKPDFFGGHSVA